jgi:prolyl oligopeptidase
MTHVGAFPATARGDLVETIHGTPVADPYRWLEDGSAPDVQRWSAEQDRFARDQLARLPGRQRLHDRLVQLNAVESMSPPVRRAGRSFYSRRAGQQKAIHYWRADDGKTHVLIDPNTLSGDGSVSIKAVTISYDGRSAVYERSQNNSDLAELHVMSVDTGEEFEIDRIPGVRYSPVSWTPANDGFYYTRLPIDDAIDRSELNAHARIYFHKLGTDYRQDALIRDQTGDPHVLLGTDVSRDGRFLFVYLVHGWKSTDVYFQDTHTQRGLRPLFVGLDARFYVSAWQGRFYVYTDHRAPHWRMLRVDDPSALGPGPQDPNAMRELVAEDPEAVLDAYSLVGGQLSLTYQRRANSQIRIVDLEGKPVRSVELPGVGTATGLYGSPDDDIAYYTFESFVQPPAIYTTSLTHGGRETYFAAKTPADLDGVRVEQLMYPSKDGTEVSMFVVTPRAFKRDGQAAFLLLGYGGFDISVVPRFDGALFAWLEAGGAAAFTNLRGGGEYGEQWHQAGTLTRKQNVFDDFISAAEFLIAQRYTNSKRLAIRGGSNAGLLVGAAMTQRPELFGAVVCQVPLLDMVRYQHFGTAKGWVGEYGSVDDPEQFKALYAYSPYHRIRDGVRYPALLVMGADSDDRVDPMHARKFVAAIQHANQGQPPAWLRIESKAGHGGADAIDRTIAAETDEYAFMFAQLGVTVR